MSLRDVVVGVLLAGGLGLAALACLGAALMPGAMARLHYTSPAALASVLLCGAVLADAGISLIGTRAIAVAALTLVTTPVLTHATARAIHRRERGDAGR